MSTTQQSPNSFTSPISADPQVERIRATDSAYGATFWAAYTANITLMIAVSLLFRYADFITFLGGGEYELGWIVGIGMLGALAMRVVQGVGIDRYGAGRIWLLSISLVFVSLLTHLSITRVDSPVIYLVRILYTSSLAGAFGASITFVSSRAPNGRPGEMIGALGSSGFVGMAVGPAMADSIFRQGESSQAQIETMFQVAAAMAFVSVLATCLANWLSPRPRSSRLPSARRPPAWWILQRYQPGPILAIGVAMGMGISIPFSFLRPFAAQLGIEGIRGFFLVYAIVAFTVRICFRRFPDRMGVRRTVLLGMLFLVLEMLSFLFVRNSTWLALPAALGGVAHAFVFPAAVTGGSLAFPLRYRGLATTLMLTVFDFGNLIGSPAVGTVLHIAEQNQWPAYPLMFSLVALMLLACSVYYAMSSATRAATESN